MRTVIRRSLGALLILLILAAGAALWKREELTRLLAVNSLFDADRIVTNFSHMDQLFLTVPVDRGDGGASPLPKGAPMTLPDGADAWMSDRNVTALIVLKDGQIRHEGYYLGTTPEDRRISWSIAKSFVAALFGTVLADGAIGSIDDPLVRYAPALAGSAYDGVSIRDVLTMSSGVTFNEDYLDFNSDINRMGRVLALGQSMDGFAAGLTARDATPGQRWQYVSIDTHIVGMVIRGATGRTLPDLLSDRIIRPLGLEVTPLYLTDGDGTAFALGGLNMISRDYARFGQMIAQGGQWQGRQIVPADWVAAMTRRQAPGGAGYGFQWWIPDDAAPGEVMARGIYGQYIWIDNARDIVIVVNAADRGFRDAGVDALNLSMFRRIADSL